MKNITKKLEQLKKESTNELEKYVLDDILDEDEPEIYIKDVLNSGCQSGTVSSLIYFSDTHDFFIKYMDEIDELREDMENSIGEPLKIGYPLSNWLAWFGYEETMRQIADKIGLEF